MPAKSKKPQQKREVSKSKSPKVAATKQLPVKRDIPSRSKSKEQNNKNKKDPEPMIKRASSRSERSQSRADKLAVIELAKPIRSKSPKPEPKSTKQNGDKKQKVETKIPQKSSSPKKIEVKEVKKEVKVEIKQIKSEPVISEPIKPEPTKSEPIKVSVKKETKSVKFPNVSEESKESESEIQSEIQPRNNSSSQITEENVKVMIKTEEPTIQTKSETKTQIDRNHESDTSDVLMKNEDESNTINPAYLSILEFSTLVEKQLALKEETHLTQSQIQVPIQNLIKDQKNKILNHNFTPRTPVPMKTMTQKEFKQKIQQNVKSEVSEPMVVQVAGNSLIGQVSGNDRINRAKIYEKRGIKLEQYDDAKKEVVDPIFGGPVKQQGMKDTKKEQNPDTNKPSGMSVQPGAQSKVVQQSYLPITLPYKRKEDDANIEVEDAPDRMAKKPSINSIKKSQSIIKLQRDEKQALIKSNDQISQMLIGDEGQDNKTKEPIFIQMPCSLPFELNSAEDNLLKIGKLRIMKSGKVILRIRDPEGTKYVDLDVSKGIMNSFYQELVSVQRSSSEVKQNKLEINKETIHYLSQIQHKLVITPNLDAVLK